MENLHDYINTGMLLILTALFFFQRSKLTYMETAMKAVDVKKIIDSQEYIMKSERMRIEDDAKKQIKQHELDILRKIRQNKSDVTTSYDEMFAVVFQLLVANDIKYQESVLAVMPKTASQMRLKLAQYDAGTSDVVWEKGSRNTSDRSRNTRL